MGKSGKGTSLTPEPRPHATAESSLRQVAHKRLDQLWDDAERTDFYGRVGVVAVFEAGKARMLERELKGSDR